MKLSDTLTVDTPAGRAEVKTVLTGSFESNGKVVKVFTATNGTQKSSGRRVLIGEHHTDYAVPMNSVLFSDGHTGILKDSEIIRD